MFDIIVIVVGGATQKEVYMKSIERLLFMFDNDYKSLNKQEADSLIGYFKGEIKRLEESDNPNHGLIKDLNSKVNILDKLKNTIKYEDFFSNFSDEVDEKDEDNRSNPQEKNSYSINYKKGKIMRPRDVKLYLLELRQEMEDREEEKRLAEIEEMNSDGYYERKVQDEDMKKKRIRDRVRAHRKKKSEQKEVDDGTDEQVQVDSRGSGSEVDASSGKSYGRSAESVKSTERIPAEQSDKNRGNGDGKGNGSGKTAKERRKDYYERKKGDSGFLARKKERRREYHEKQKEDKERRRRERVQAGPPKTYAEMSKEEKIAVIKERQRMIVASKTEK